MDTQHSQSSKFKGSSLLRGKVVGAFLTSTRLQLQSIRETAEEPGLKEYEISFLQLVEKLTNGTELHIDVTGTKMSMKPGVIIGGSGVEHDSTATGRGIGYYIEGILPLCMFAKRPARITFYGVTTDARDTCIETLNTVTFPLLEKFGLEQLPEVKLVERGSLPNGKGKVEFFCPTVRKLDPIHLVDPGYVKRVRGVAHAIRVSPQFANRMVDSARGVLNNFIPDVYINTDHTKRSQTAATDPGFGVMLFAESTTGCFYGAKRVAQKSDQSSLGHAGVSATLDPEALGENTAKQLCEEIVRGGCVDSSHQALVLLLMVLTSEDVSKVRLGPLTPYTIEYLRLLHKMYGVKFKIDVDNTSVFEPGDELPQEEKEYDSVLLSCRGIGFSNISRRVT